MTPCYTTSWDLTFVRAHGDILAERFPIPGRRTLELLGAGVNPGGSSIILL